MNEKQLELIETVMDMVSHTAEMMLKDEFYAPPAWIIENWWHTLNAVLKISYSTSEAPTESSQES